ncbi:MAG: hypothetical protein QXX08_05265 [Candidatus Bathyarchaeia archaeon]
MNSSYDVLGALLEILWMASKMLEIGKFKRLFVKSAVIIIVDEGLQWNSVPIVELG